MSYSVNITPDASAPRPSTSEIFDLLPSVSDTVPHVSTAAHQKIDLMLLALEALTVGGTDKILARVQQLGLDKIIKNRMFLWRLRCTNPLRRSYQRNRLTMEEAKALVIIIHELAKSLEVKIRQHLIDAQMMKDKDLPVDNHFQLSGYLEKFRKNFAYRMNPRRVKVMNYLNEEDDLNELALSLLAQLLLCSGTRGRQRFWVSLFDGEVK
ncbi:DUF3038 domain-containing protein [Gloeocapsa sp. PCC 73106]|uniref:DUF3038 domain-containing protein n=1 Tax=Gloeocapsa sp. PCC 73106 TaxID=102232 RepID=UPI0002ABDC0C|nr:DUF3038 domain-containing protein [Gloeocapsa sp. PCC 73106]ELR97953.1 Protein of unknown function (DUF3038) [Gloeocapsa sp. PCC 73106]